MRDIAVAGGTTNKELADELGVNPSNLSRWATGKDGRQPPVKVIRWMARRVNRAVVITPDEILIIPASAAKVLAGYDGVDLQ